MLPASSVIAAIHADAGVIAERYPGGPGGSDDPAGQRRRRRRLAAGPQLTARAGRTAAATDAVDTGGIIAAAARADAIVEQVQPIGCSALPVQALAEIRLPGSGCSVNGVSGEADLVSTVEGCFRLASSDQHPGPGPRSGGSPTSPSRASPGDRRTDHGPGAMEQLTSILVKFARSEGCCLSASTTMGFRGSSQSPRISMGSSGSGSVRSGLLVERP